VTARTCPEWTFPTGLTATGEIVSCMTVDGQLVPVEASVVPWELAGLLFAFLCCAVLMMTVLGAAMRRF
jgi:hypothetical protein